MLLPYGLTVSQKITLYQIITEGRTEEERALFKTIHAFGQEHVLRFWNEIDEKGRDALVADIKKIDLSLIERIRPVLLENRTRMRRVEKPDIILVPTTEPERKRQEEARRFLFGPASRLRRRFASGRPVPGGAASPARPGW